MSTRGRQCDDDPSQDGPSDDGPSTYAPKRARLPKAEPDKELAGVKPAPISETPESPEPPWRRRNRAGAFGGDLDIVELRHRLGPGDRIPEPPWPDSSGSMLAAARRATLIVAAAAGIAAGVIGYRWSGVSPTPSTPQQPAYVNAKIVDMTALEPPAPVEGLRPPSRNDNQPDVQLATTDIASWHSAPPTSTPPAPTSTAPPGGQGSPEPASPPSLQRPDAAQIAVMVKRGGEFMANGNIGAARVMFRPAAEAGDATAAFALAETYDPFVLERLGAKGGITPDVTLARRWYEAAKDLGSVAAPDRLVRLARRSD